MKLSLNGTWQLFCIEEKGGKNSNLKFYLVWIWTHQSLTWGYCCCFFERLNTWTILHLAHTFPLLSRIKLFL